MLIHGFCAGHARELVSVLTAGAAKGPATGEPPAALGSESGAKAETGKRGKRRARAKRRRRAAPSLGE